MYAKSFFYYYESFVEVWEETVSRNYKDILILGFSLKLEINFLDFFRGPVWENWFKDILFFRFNKELIYFACKV